LLQGAHLYKSIGKLTKEKTMPIAMRISGRDFEAELMPDLRVVVREQGHGEVTYSLSDAFSALLPQSPENVLRSTADQAVRMLLRKHADKA
jgi:hypothetical protein